MHKRVARLVIRLYPRQWRERYADEFAALLDDGGLTYRAAIDGARGAGGEWGRLVRRRLHLQRTRGLTSRHAEPSEKLPQARCARPYSPR